MARRLKLIVAYDGTSFAGWQSQPNGNAIQDHLERALRRICGQAVRVHGAGRTDAGVHALAQCVHADVPDRLPLNRWSAALNAVLPPTIRIMRSQDVPDNFHARYSAKGKVYRYRIWAGPVLPPRELGRAWHITGPIDFDLLKSATTHFAGTHDFAGFAANRGKPESNTTRTLYSAKVRRAGRCITLEFDGDGFLYKMVRLVVGALVQCATAKLPAKDLVRRLSGGRITHARLTAPPQGLFLVRVRY